MAIRRLISLLAAMLLLAIAAAVYAACAPGPPEAPAESEPGRYYLAVGSDSWLLDTQTGRVWVATGGRKDAHWVETRVEGLNALAAPQSGEAAMQSSTTSGNPANPGTSLGASPGQ